jgi:hypothetical protein
MSEAIFGMIKKLPGISEVSLLDPNTCLSADRAIGIEH